MSLASPPDLKIVPTVADLLARLGDIPPDRVRLHPAPGLATEADVDLPGAKLCELVDGCLVEKAMGLDESLLASYLIMILGQFALTHDLGMIGGEAGTIRLGVGLVRIPDVAFYPWDQLARSADPPRAVPNMVPDLAVEVLSRGNTRGEMDRKVAEYLAAGTRLVWLIDLDGRTAQVIAPDADPITLDATGTLDGGAVLPGFALPLSSIFAFMDRRRRT